MKAKIKATGEIVHVGDYNTISHDPMYKNEKTGPWRLKELDFAIDPDYWTRLEHQYAGMAMQGILSNQDYCRLLVDENIKGSFAEDVSRCASGFAHALVKKMKEERK
jgi:hypothetical protein